MSEEWSTVPLRGFRRWRLNSEAELCGIAYGLPWKPGVNEAECPLVVELTDYAGRAIDTVPFKPWPHPLEGCSHGFYARFTHRDGFDGMYPVTGMIEAWGEVIQGPDGFKAEKAKIVALVLPELPGKPSWKRRLWFGSKSYPVPDVLERERQLVIPDDYNRKVREQYADVPIFATFEEMLEKFPIDEGEFPVERREGDPEPGQFTVRRGGITYPRPTRSASRRANAALRAMMIRHQDDQRRRNP